MKKFFYKDSDGKIKRYVYCTKCEKGPFREDQLNIEYFKMAEKISLFYCKKCAINLGLPVTENKDVNNIDNNNQIEDIDFKKDTELYIVLVQFYDGSIQSFVCENINDLINTAKISMLVSKFPMEILYYKKFKNKEIVDMKNKIDSMTVTQKKLFIKNYYSKVLRS